MEYGAIKYLSENKNLVQVFCDFYDLGFQRGGTTSAVRKAESQLKGESGEVFEARGTRIFLLDSQTTEQQPHILQKCRLSG